MAPGVPKCSATSNARAASGQPNANGARVRCAQLLTGRNSVSPLRDREYEGLEHAHRAGAPAFSA
jgi:hypothetical protein